MNAEHPPDRDQARIRHLILMRRRAVANDDRRAVAEIDAELEATGVRRAAVDTPEDGRLVTQPEPPPGFVSTPAFVENGGDS